MIRPSAIICSMSVGKFIAVWVKRSPSGDDSCDLQEEVFLSMDEKTIQPAAQLPG
jgi:hypothetical protein